MKCIQHCMDNPGPNDLPALILRVSDETAHQKVSLGQWRYVSKSAWKQNVRDWKQEKEKEPENKPEWAEYMQYPEWIANKFGK